MTSRIEFEDYYSKHQFCPKCNSNDIEQTTMGVLWGNEGNLHDRNRAICMYCGWRGEVHDLIAGNHTNKRSLKST